MDFVTGLPSGRDWSCAEFNIGTFYLVAETPLYDLILVIVNRLTDMVRYS